jgi:hypothetical protein
MADARAPVPPPAASPAATAPAAVTVGELRLRLPAANAAEGRRVVERALALAARGLPPGTAGDLSRLTLRVRPRSLTEAGLSEAIAEALLEAVRKRGAPAAAPAPRGQERHA